MWTQQKQGTKTKLIVYYNDNEAQKSQTYHAFAGEDTKGTARAGLTKRILQKKDFGRYRTAIFYENDVEVERWSQGVKTKITTN